MPINVVPPGVFTYLNSLAKKRPQKLASAKNTYVTLGACDVWNSLALDLCEHMNLSVESQLFFRDGFLVDKEGLELLADKT